MICSTAPGPISQLRLLESPEAGIEKSGAVRASMPGADPVRALETESLSFRSAREAALMNLDGKFFLNQNQERREAAVNGGEN
jgi:hypothetical protein